MIAMGSAVGETIAEKTNQAIMSLMARKGQEREDLMGRNLIPPAVKTAVTATAAIKILRPEATVKGTRENPKNQEAPESRMVRPKARRPRNRGWADLYQNFLGDNAPHPTPDLVAEWKSFV